jgi:hypothetical protein
MKWRNTLWLVLLAVSQAMGQVKGFRPTYTFEGTITTTTGQKLPITRNFLVLLDSTMVGSYYYTPRNGSLKLVGKLRANNTFQLVERNEVGTITGYFHGQLASDKKRAAGEWSSPTQAQPFSFKLAQVVGKSYWDYIHKNRSLQEYTSLKAAIRKGAKVLSVDVASQELSSLPSTLDKLTRIVSINLLGNNFTAFPSILSELSTLDEVSLSSNKLTTVGPEIGRLKELRILIMNNNQLRELPKEVGELTNLLYLEIGNNRLASLPEQVKYLTNLQELHIERNDLNGKEKKRIQQWLPNCIIHF